jgi:D-3-phosphoglycerate dehydrogenase / 2-oxoglutarate reductase
MATNKKRVLVTESMSKAARDLLEARDNIEVIRFTHMFTGDAFRAVLKEHAPIAAFALGATRISKEELDLAREIAVVARIGVGFDAIDIPELTKRGIPLMVAGTANSPSVAEQAIFMMMMLAKRGAELHALVTENRWGERLGMVPFDLFEKTVLVIGFGRIGTRTARRCDALDMNVLVYDPYKADDEIRAAGYEPVSDLDAAVARADFISIHCPKSPETIGMFDAARIGRMKPTAYLVNTARGGLIDEAALHAALVDGQLAGAGIDVFASEPVEPDNPLLRLPNVITSPHMAGVTREALDRMSMVTARNILSVFDGKPVRENVINTEVLGD